MYWGSTAPSHSAAPTRKAQRRGYAGWNAIKSTMSPSAITVSGSGVSGVAGLSARTASMYAKPPSGSGSIELAANCYPVKRNR